MAAVLALVMLPIIASLGFMLGLLRADGSFVAACTAIVFALLAAGVLGGALRVMRDAENS